MLFLSRPESSRAGSRLDAPRPRRSRQHRPALDALEGRQLMTLGAPFQVNLAGANFQRTAAVTSAPDGRSVVVWAEQATNSNQANIRGRLIDANGAPIGSDLNIATTPLDESDPAVAINDKGEFVVTWTRREAGGKRDIRAQRFSAQGVKLGGAVNVSAGDGATVHEDSDVAVKPNGDFVVAYVKRGPEFDGVPINEDLVVRRFGKDLALKGTSFIDSPRFGESEPSVVIAPNGGYYVAYTQESLSNSGVPDVVMQRFSPSGTKLGQVEIAKTSVEERDPDLGFDAFGNVVVAYQKFVNGTIEIKAKRVTGGSTVGDEINVSTDPSFFAFDPEVAVNRITGDFVVAYGRVRPDGAFQGQAVEVSASNTILLSRNLAFGDDDPHVSIDGDGNYLVVYTSPNGTDDNIFARRGRR